MLLKPRSSTLRDTWCLICYFMLSEFLGIYFRITENNLLFKREFLPPGAVETVRVLVTLLFVFFCFCQFGSEGVRDSSGRGNPS